MKGVWSSVPAAKPVRSRPAGLRATPCGKRPPGRARTAGLAMAMWTRRRADGCPEGSKKARCGSVRERSAGFYVPIRDRLPQGRRRGAGCAWLRWRLRSWPTGAGSKGSGCGPTGRLSAPLRPARWRSGQGVSSASLSVRVSAGRPSMTRGSISRGGCASRRRRPVTARSAGARLSGNSVARSTAASPRRPRWRAPQSRGERMRVNDSSRRRRMGRRRHSSRNTSVQCARSSSKTALTLSAEARP